MKEFLRLLPFKEIFHLLPSLQIGRGFVLLVILLVISSSGCLFGGRKEPTAVATSTQPDTPPIAPTPSSTQEPQKSKEEIRGFPAERQELYEDILNRLRSLERDYQYLKDKVSMQEFLIGEASKDSKKTKEEMRAELEKLRSQLSEYNALVLRILDRISKEPKKQEQP